MTRTGRRLVVRRHRRGVRRPRHGLDPRQRRPTDGIGHRPRHDVGARGDQPVRSAAPRRAAGGVRGRRQQRGVPLRAGRARSRIGSAPVLALRIGYVGELGWELHIPTEYAAHVYELLRAAGEPHGIVDVGYRAIDTLRMEKGYLYWSTDITPDTTPWEAGLGWRVDLDKGDFCGRDALVAQRDAGVSRRLCTFTLESMAYPVSGEAIIADGDGGRVHDQRQLRPHRRQADRLRLPAGRAGRRAPTSRSRSTASRSRRPATPARCTTRQNAQAARHERSTSPTDAAPYARALCRARRRRSGDGEPPRRADERQLPRRAPATDRYVLRIPGDGHERVHRPRAPRPWPRGPLPTPASTPRSCSSTTRTG